MSTSTSTTTTTLNLGILAHVDAGKTSLTERLLHHVGVIDEVGSVDAGSTRTDSLALERRRGITIKSAVVSFEVDGVTVNLIDTPGHPDFIAEVERVLDVLDGAVLVVSAVEGVQAQTRVLARTLRRLGIPTLVFVNKIDRAGADVARVLREIEEKLTPACVAMGAARDEGHPGAGFRLHGPGDAEFTAALTERLAEHDDELLAAYVDGVPVPYGRLRRELAVRSRESAVHPVFAGSAATGAGVDALVAHLTELLPARAGDADGPACGTVFTIDRGPGGEKTAYVRMLSGTVRVREALPYGAAGGEAKVTGIGVFTRGECVPCDALTAGRIGTLRGLPDVRIGDTVGAGERVAARRHFAPPTLETVVVPRTPGEAGAVHAALTRLAEQDPLICLRQDDVRGEMSVSLYGEVQKEVIQATLAEDFDVDVTFRQTTTVCVERLTGTGEAVEIIDEGGNPFLGTVGLRVGPAPVGSGVDFRLDVELGSMPRAFMTAVEETVRAALRQGPHGWDVPDCVVTLTHSGYWARQSHAHGTFDASMSSTAGDFRHLTPLVLMDALRRAGTVVCEPVHRFRLECPAEAFAAVLNALARLEGVPRSSELRGGTYVVEGDIPAGRVHDLERRLPGLTRGEGVLESAFDHHAPVRGAAPSRPRTDHNPLDREEYLLHVVRRV